MLVQDDFSKQKIANKLNAHVRSFLKAKNSINVECLSKTFFANKKNTIKIKVNNEGISSRKKFYGYGMAIQGDFSKPKIIVEAECLSQMIFLKKKRQRS